MEYHTRVTRFTCKFSRNVNTDEHQSFIALTANFSMGTQIVLLDIQWYGWVAPFDCIVATGHTYIDASVNGWCTSIKFMKVYDLITLYHVSYIVRCVMRSKIPINQMCELRVAITTKLNKIRNKMKMIK